MLLRDRCLLLVPVVVLAGSAACSAPSPPSLAPRAAARETGIVFHARATKATEARLGITRWHAIVEPGTGAVVVDGSDAKGKVRFATAFRMDKSGASYHVESYAQKGSLTFDMRTGHVLANTLPRAEWALYAGSFAADWQAFQQTVPYGAWGYVSNGLWIAAGVATVAAALITSPVWATAAGVGAGVIGIAAGVTGAVDLYQSDQAAAASAAQQAQQQQAQQQQIESLQQQIQAQQQQLQQQAQQPAQGPDAPAQGPDAPAQTPDAPTQGPDGPAGQTPSAPAGDSPASSATPGEPAQAQSLPPDSSGGNLDTTGGGLDSSSSGAGPSAGDSSSAGPSAGDSSSAGPSAGGAEPGASSSGAADPGASSSDGADPGAGSSGGDTSGAALAAQTCRKVACSKTTKVCLCTRY